MSKIIKIWLLSLFVLFIWSCNTDDDELAPPSWDVLVEIDSLAYTTVSEISERLGGSPQLAAVLDKDIVAYRLTYKTTFVEGEEIQASGLVLVPQKEGMLPLLSYQHGTLRNKNQAPSNYDQNGAEGYFVGPLFASNGFLMVLPDYIGYGVSEDLLHPYEDAQLTAKSCYDFLQAVLEFAEYKEIPLLGKTYLAGYSQGGFSTMALTKYIEEETDFEITASAPAAGAYNKLGFAERILEIEDEIPYMDVYLWVVDTYNRLYPGLQRPWSYYLNEPYATQAEAHGEGPFTPINNTRPQDIFTAEFMAELQDENSPFVAALKANNNYDWRPTTPIRLYHGSEDDFVFPENSIDAFDAMQANGATQVELKFINGGDHFTSTQPYFNDILAFYFKGF